MQATPPQDTGKFRENSKDQFYTKPAVAAECVRALLEHLGDSASEYLWIEPSAGAGAFLVSLPPALEHIGIDIEPHGEGIVAANFLEWTLPPLPPGKKVCCFGNPPFGRQSSLAKAFIRRAAEFSDVIAFILPRSFVKPSMSGAFPLQFHCVHTHDIPPNSFSVNDEDYDVPCVFQIWQARDEDRTLEAKVLPVGFAYVKSDAAGDADYDLAFRRVGVFAGRCFKKSTMEKYSAQSHYFLKFERRDGLDIDALIEGINAHEFPTNTVGPRSLSKSEANLVINQLLLAAAQAQAES
jgi:hypothetical protein